MSTTILHVGDDVCHRILVMEHSGLSVVESDCTVPALQVAFAQGYAFSAVAFQNETGSPPPVVISTARALSTAPLVLFQHPSISCDEGLFDLVIPIQTPPAVWLKSLAEVINNAPHLQRKFPALREDCADAVSSSRAERRTSVADLR